MYLYLNGYIEKEHLLLVLGVNSYIKCNYFNFISISLILNVLFYTILAFMLRIYNKRYLKFEKWQIVLTESEENTLNICKFYNYTNVLNC